MNPPCIYLQKPVLNLPFAPRCSLGGKGKCCVSNSLLTFGVKSVSKACIYFLMGLTILFSGGNADYAMDLQQKEQVHDNAVSVMQPQQFSVSALLPRFEHRLQYWN